MEQGPAAREASELDPLDAFPASVRSAAAAILEGLPPPIHRLNQAFDVVVGDEVLRIPYRVYNPPITADELGGLSVGSQAILDCVYSRHHDGHVRHASARRLLAVDAGWVAPFTIKLLGEYVVEIAVDIRDALQGWADNSSPLVTYRGFADANRPFINRTTAQATSYWNCYYRFRWPDRREYPGLVALGLLGGHP